MSHVDAAPTGPDSVTRERTAVAPAAVERGGHQLGVFTSELALTFRRTRNLVLLAVLAAVPVLLGVAVRLSTRGGSGFIGQVSNNGLFLVFTAFTFTLALFLPLAVGVVSGDSVAGEAGMGTLRYLLVAPAGRTRLLLAKFAVIVVFCVVATLVVAAAALAVGAVLFPLGRVTLLSGTQITFGAALLRMLLVTLCVAASLLGVATIGLFVSSLTNSSLSAMATTVGLTISVQIMDQVPQLSAIHPWLFSNYWLSFGDLLNSPMYTTNVTHNLLLQAGYVAVFGSAAWARFTSRDITS